MTALVPADNMAALEPLTPEARETAVTHMLSEARSWLAHAMEASEPASIATFKAQMATVAEATKQLGLSKEIQLDAQEMVRRAERGVGVAIRKGQAEGTVRRQSDNQYTDRNSQTDSIKVNPTDLVKSHELAGVHGNGGIYAMTDDVTDEQFNDAVAEAKSEANLSRANVVRKINGDSNGMTRKQRADVISDLAARGYSSRQMPARVGVSEETVRVIARDFNIDIPADKMTLHTRRLDHTHMVESTVTALDNLVSALNLIEFAEVDPAQAAEWATSLTQSIAALKRFHNQIKEMTHD